MAAGEKDSGGGSHHLSTPKRGAQYLAKYVFRGGAVIHAVQGHLRSPTSDDIVFGKETSLEMVIVDEDGIVQSVCEQPVFGIIKDLAILGWNDKFRQSRPQMIGKDLLVVLSDSGKLSFLAFSFEMHRFLVLNHIQLSKPGNSINHIGRMLAVDPDGSFIAASAYEDQFALFSMSTHLGDSIVDEKMFYPPENKDETSFVKDTVKTNICGTIWSICFVSHGTDHSSKGFYPIMATIMHRKGRLRNELLLFGCTVGTRAIQFISSYPEVEIGPLALKLSAVPHLSGFAVVFRIDDALLMNFRDPYCIQCVQRINFGLPSVIEEPDFFHDSSRSMDIDDEGMSSVAVCALLELSDSAATMAKDDPMSVDNGIEAASTSKHVCACCWEPVGSASANLVLCLDSGELYILEIHSTIEGIRSDLSECLYRGLPCKELLWLKGGFVMGLVEMGDGLVLKLDDGGLVYKSNIQNIAPILDLAVVDDHDEKQDQMFSCCGMNPAGSLRVIRSGLSVDKLVKTPPVYEGITGTWTLRMKRGDPYHSFLVLSFVEETRVLSVGLSFCDVTDATGFQPDVCTLACGLVSDGLLVQIHRAGVRLSLPTTAAHVSGCPHLIPFCTSWSPDNVSISSAAVGHNAILIVTSNPCILFVLGIRSLSAYQNELYEIQHLSLQHEVSCISIPEQEINFEQLSSNFHLAKKDNQDTVFNGDGCHMTFVVGTHIPSVEVLSFSPVKGFKFLATGAISIDNALGTPLSSCIPQDVRLVLADKFYVLAGLRNGVLLRYELPQTSVLSPSSYYPTKLGNFRSVQLELIAIRRFGIAPVVLVPLQNSLNADVVVLCEMPWLLHVARHSIVYTSISFQAATHATSVSSFDCPNGILFVADSSLNLLELGHRKRLNVGKFSIEGTPRKILYHKESKTLLILRTGLRDTSFSSDICRLDPFNGVMISKFSCELGETAKCMQIMRIGYQHLLVVGTSQCPGRTIMPNGEAESTKGRLIILSLDHAQNASESSSLTYNSNFSSLRIPSPLHEAVGHAAEKLSSTSVGSSPDDWSSDGVQIEEMEAGNFRVIYQNQLPGAVLAVCPFLNRYLLASSGNILNVFCFVTDNPLRLRKHTMTKTRFTITCLNTCFTRIAVGDCRDGILFYSYTDDLRKLEQLYADPVQRLVADCTLLDMDTAVVSDRRGSISVLSNVDDLDGSESPEKNLLVNCSYYMGESVISIRKGFFSYRPSLDDLLNDSDDTDIACKSLSNSIVASTLLGSVLLLVPITSEEHYFLETVQARLAVYPLTAPVLGNDHKEFRGRLSKAGVPTMLDGDMLLQFLELTRIQQEAVLSLPSFHSTNASTSDSHPPLSVNQVVQILERIHHALT